MKENNNVEHYLKIIDEIERIRTKNNVNWMDLLRLAFTHAPLEAKKLMGKIFHQMIYLPMKTNLMSISFYKKMMYQQII